MGSRILAGTEQTVPEWLIERMAPDYEVGDPEVLKRESLRRSAGPSAADRWRPALRARARRTCRDPSPAAEGAGSGACNHFEPAHRPMRMGRDRRRPRARRVRGASAVGLGRGPYRRTRFAERSRIRLCGDARRLRARSRRPLVAAEAVALEDHLLTSHFAFERGRDPIRQGPTGRSRCRESLLPPAPEGHQPDAASRKHSRPRQLQRATADPSPLEPRHIGPRGGQAARLSRLVPFFTAAKWHGFRQVGNSVCPPFARAVAISVRDALELPAVAAPDGRLRLGSPRLLTVPSGAGRRKPTTAPATGPTLPSESTRKAA